jgi:flagellar hook-length control protein FliK
MIDLNLDRSAPPTIEPSVAARATAPRADGPPPPSFSEHLTRVRPDHESPRDARADQDAKSRETPPDASPPPAPSTSRANGRNTNDPGSDSSSPSHSAAHDRPTKPAAEAQDDEHNTTGDDGTDAAVRLDEAATSLAAGLATPIINESFPARSRSDPDSRHPLPVVDGRDAHVEPTKQPGVNATRTADASLLDTTTGANPATTSGANQQAAETVLPAPSTSSLAYDATTSSPAPRHTASAAPVAREQEGAPSVAAAAVTSPSAQLETAIGRQESNFNSARPTTDRPLTDAMQPSDDLDSGGSAPSRQRTLQEPSSSTRSKSQSTAGGNAAPDPIIPTGVGPAPDQFAAASPPELRGVSDQAPREGQKSLAAEPAPPLRGVEADHPSTDPFLPNRWSAGVTREPGFRDTALALPTESGRRGISDVEHARLMQRVARAIATTGERDGLVRLRLSPPELGSLRLEIALRDGLVHARLEADTPQTRALLLDGMPGLRDRLAEQDLQLGRYDVDLMQSPADGSPWRSREDARDAPAGPRGDRRPAIGEVVGQEATARVVPESSQRLNVII